ncbi:YfiR family protein [Opitutus sp. ER46]|uniref:YfiR family protein n=1 Tax=Opitutus sp. ER46 TaxID=2161864 RepID=UPI000D3241CE|nr:YfiR family protein [Opitutus sp. ER46]PTX91069.1 DUF4154 domain-containing protein [Opitutus sp. ER46]
MPPAFPIFRIVRRSLVTTRWLVLFWLGTAAGFGAEVAHEHQIKAAFLYNFTRFVEWPPSRFATPDTPITIGVMGSERMVRELERIVAHRQVNGRAIAVVPVTTAAEARLVHILFVAAESEIRLEEKLPAGVLTVGETERFAALDGMITFITEQDRVRFMINLAAANHAELKLSSQLLKLASTVRREP